MDPYEKYDMTFNGAAPARVLTTSPGRYAGQDNGWALGLLYQPLLDFDKSVMKFPNIRRFVGGASNPSSPWLPERNEPKLAEVLKPGVSARMKRLREIRRAGTFGCMPCRAG